MQTDKLADLKPCPCGSSNWRVQLSYADDLDWYCVECGDCYKTGPHKGTEAEAIAAWNTRHAEAEQQGEGPTDAFHLTCPKCEQAIDLIPSPREAEADAVERVANALANADLDGPDPDEYWDYLARAVLSSAPADDTKALLREALIAAYTAGATDVHDHWVSGNTEREADFTEVVHDYADAHLAGDV